MKASRPTVRTLTINKSRDFIVDKITKPCEEGNHARCTGWAVIRKEISSINANYFLRCTCPCHRKKQQLKQKKRKQLKSIKKKTKQKPKSSKRGKKSKRTRRR